MNATLNVLKVVASGPVTSFRYPHFAQGTQPSYDMPPPATLYGHIASALGFLPDVDSFRIGVNFTYAGRFLDFEHVHLFGSKGGPKLSPFRRELLFRPRLTLYIDRPDWYPALRRPRYVVTLGRSQDLMMYESVSRVTLEAVSAAYVEDTLLPLAYQPQPLHRVAASLPRYVSPQRDLTWGQYTIVRGRQRLNAERGSIWVDPDTPRWQDMQRAVTWLSFATDHEQSA